MLQAAEFVQFVGAQAGEDPEDHPVALYEHLVLSSVRRCVLHNKAVEGGEELTPIALFCLVYVPALTRMPPLLAYSLCAIATHTWTKAPP